MERVHGGQTVGLEGGRTGQLSDVERLAAADMESVGTMLEDVWRRVRQPDGSIDASVFDKSTWQEILVTAAGFAFWMSSDAKPHEAAGLMASLGEKPALDSTAKLQSLRETVFAADPERELPILEPLPSVAEIVMGALRLPPIQAMVREMHEMPGLDTAARIHE